MILKLRVTFCGAVIVVYISARDCALVRSVAQVRQSKSKWKGSRRWHMKYAHVKLAEEKASCVAVPRRGSASVGSSRLVVHGALSGALQYLLLERSQGHQLWSQNQCNMYTRSEHRIAIMSFSHASYCSRDCGRLPIQLWRSLRRSRPIGGMNCFWNGNRLRLTKSKSLSQCMIIMPMQTSIPDTMAVTRRPQ